MPASITTNSPREGITKTLHDRNKMEGSSHRYSADAVSPKFFYDDNSGQPEFVIPGGYCRVENFITDQVVMARGDYVL